jgi:signal transduction histidine kinase
MNELLNIESLYRIFRDISSSVHSDSSVKEVLDLLVKRTTEVLGARGTILRILNLETRQLELGAWYGLSPEYIAKGPVSSQKIITDLCRHNKVIIIDDILADPRIQYPQEAWREGLRMALDLPLTIGSHVVGVIRVYFDKKRIFSDEELNFVVFIAEQSSCLIDKARMVEIHQSQYQQLALQTEKLAALGRMAAGIAHEINNPLTGILLYSSNLVKKVPPEGAVKEGLDVIIHETIRCRSIIQELLEFARDKTPERIPANINDIILRTLSILENEFRLQHIKIEKQLSNDLPDILLDVNQMQQVFINLLLNAIEAIYEEGAITVRSEQDPGKKLIKIEVADTGCGIPPENINQIFEPFFSTKKKGTGLGLSVSYGIVQNHHGRIQVTSQPGKGSRFTIELPIFTEKTAPKTLNCNHETGKNSDH